MIREIGVTTFINVTGVPVPYQILLMIIRQTYVKLLELWLLSIFEISDINIKNLKDKDIIYKIDCLGPADDTKGPKICAASSRSFYNQSLWNIFLTSSSIKLSDKPVFMKVAKPLSKIEDSIEDNFDKLPTSVKEYLSSQKTHLMEDFCLIE